MWPKSIIEELFVGVSPVLPHVALTPREEISTDQAVEINQHHNIHRHHAEQEVPAVVHPGVIVQDVPGEVELGAQTKQDVGEEVGEFVDVVQGGGLSAGQFQQQPQVKRDTVHLHEESDDSAGDIQLSEERVRETPDHQHMMK